MFVVSGVSLRLKKIRWSGSSDAITTSRCAEHLGGEGRDRDGPGRLRVLGCAWRCVGLPVGDTMVPQIRTVAGDTVTSTSHLRIASTSPMRADVPSMTSMICSSWPSGGGPGQPGPSSPALRQHARMASTCSTVSAIAWEGGLRSRAVSRTGFFAHRVVPDRQPEGEAEHGPAPASPCCSSSSSRAS